MKVIMLMFDSLNRHYLPPYGGNRAHAPNFARLAEKTLTFDTSYVCSMPCMPARRDLHTGRPNFLHRSWGPLEPFDDSMPEILKNKGVHTHLATDHYHYFEDGGGNYHNRYSTWEGFRGQEGDHWIPQIADPELPPRRLGRHENPENPMARQDGINRSRFTSLDTFPQGRTMEAGLEFLRMNLNQDQWFLQVETFDPHEPFTADPKFRDLYMDRHLGDDVIFDWPIYRPVEESAEAMEHLRAEYCATLSMCDHHLGRYLDFMDEHDMWKDTMLIVWTDHGFLLGEHGNAGKCWCPFYEQIARTPFFVWDPRTGHQGGRRQSLVQPSIDLAPTLLRFFGLEPTTDMTGQDLAPVISDDRPVRKYGLFGMHGAQVNITDGRYVYIRGPRETSRSPVYEYTLMPQHMARAFSLDVLRNTEGLAEPFSFTKGVKTLKIPRIPPRDGGKPLKPNQITALYDLRADPAQEHPVDDPELESSLAAEMAALMRDLDAPSEQYERLGIA